MSLMKRLLRSYERGKGDVAAGLNNWSHNSFNNRAENSHLPFPTENEPCRVADRREYCNSSFLCTALPTSLFCFRPPPRSTNNSLPPRSVRCIENCCLHRLKIRAASFLGLGKFNVTTCHEVTLQAGVARPQASVTTLSLRCL